MMKIITRRKYDDLVNTIAFQEHQIESLAKQLKEAKRRNSDGKFKKIEGDFLTR